MTDDIQKIKELFQKFNNIKWGDDGDCGAQVIIDELEDIVDRAIKN